MTRSSIPSRPPLTAEQRAACQVQIDLANAEMCAAKTAALDAYRRVHPVGHTRCTDLCREASQQLGDRFSDINAAYQAALPRVD